MKDYRKTIEALLTDVIKHSYSNKKINTIDFKELLEFNDKEFIEFMLNVEDILNNFEGMYNLLCKIAEKRGLVILEKDNSTTKNINNLDSLLYNIKNDKKPTKDDKTSDDDILSKIFNKIFNDVDNNE